MAMKSAVALFYFLCAVGATECQLPLDIMFLQDTTISLTDVVPNLLSAIPRLLTDISATFPGTHIGMAQFQDKPYAPLGHADGMCYKLMAMLGTDLEPLITSYNALTRLSGQDIPEDQYQGIISTVMDATVGWRPPSLAEITGAAASFTGSRFVIMTTDSRPHLAGDMALYTAFNTVPQGLPANSGHMSTDDIDHECLHQEYPSPQQLKEALTLTDTKLIILTPEDPTLTPVWNWVNTNLLGQPSEFYQFIKADYSDVYEAVMRALAVVSNVVPCPTETPSTTSPADATSAPSSADATSAPSPADASTITSPADASVVTIPADASMVTIPADGSMVTIPADASSVTIPADASSVTIPADASMVTSSPINCEGCPCSPSGPCNGCAANCDAAVVLRFAKEPKKLQVLVNNE